MDTTFPGLDADACNHDEPKASTPRYKADRKFRESSLHFTLSSSERLSSASLTQDSLPSVSMSEDVSQSSVPPVPMSKDASQSSVPLVPMSKDVSQRSRPSVSTSHDVPQCSSQSATMFKDVSQRSVPSPPMSKDVSQRSLPSAPMSSKDVSQHSVLSAPMSKDASQRPLPSVSVSKDVIQRSLPSASMSENVSEHSQSSVAMSEDASQHSQSSASTFEDIPQCSPPPIPISKDNQPSSTPSTNTAPAMPFALTAEHYFSIQHEDKNVSPFPFLPKEEYMAHKAVKQRQPTAWKQNVRKRLREAGLEYTRQDGQVAPPKQMKEPCGCSGKNTSCSLFTKKDREETFNHIWNVSWNEKRNYVYGLVDKVDVGRRTNITDAKLFRKFNLKYTLKRNGAKLPVCRTMFLNTTALTYHFVRSLFETSANDDAEGAGSLKISKQKFRPANPYYQRSEEANALLRKFLDDLPKTPIHYAKKNTTKLFLEMRFKSLSEVHAEYMKFCHEKNVKPLKIQAFTNVFKSKKLSLFIPKNE